MTQRGQKYYLTTTTEGCATNLLENASYRNVLEDEGYTSTATADDADVILINTCAYTTDQEERSQNLIKETNKKFPGKKVLVAGCYTSINKEGLKSVHEGKSFGPGDVSGIRKEVSTNKEIKKKDKLANFFNSADYLDLSKKHLILLKARPLFFKLEKLLGRNFQHMHNLFDSVIINQEYFGITLSQGCAGKCTFCVIKNAKGYVKSRPSSEIFHEFQSGLQQGHKKFWLLGDDIGCYGIDNDETIVDLLKKFICVDLDFKLVINYFEPYFFLKYFEELKEVLQDSRIININIPIQSGDAKIVRQMGREYDPYLVLKKIDTLKLKNPNIVIKNNIIVGFPGESYKQFFQSIKAVFHYDANLALQFTSRPGTGAHRYKNHVAKPQIKLRHLVINFFIFFRHAFIFIKSFLNSKKVEPKKYA